MSGLRQPNGRHDVSLARTFPAFLSSSVSWLTGGPGRDSFFSMPRSPRAKIALSAK